MFSLDRKFYLHSDKKNKNPLTVREFTLDELKGLTGHCYFITKYGTLTTAKVTSVQVWKRSPGNCDIHLKYGLWEYFIASYVNGVSTGEQLVKVIDTESNN